MRSLEAANPAPRDAGTGFGNRSSLAAGSGFDANTNAILVQRLRHRFGLSDAVATVVIHLAGLGSMEARHG
jgi:hypothetical protein